MKPTIYLAGPIAGCNDGEVHDWREEAKRLLSDHFEFRDPTSRDFRGKDATEHASLIVNGDKFDINDSQVVLANMWKMAGPMVGTSMEIMYAWERFCPVVTVVPPDYSVSPWITYHSERVFTDLEDACAFIKLSYAPRELALA